MILKTIDTVKLQEKNLKTNHLPPETYCL